MGAASRGGQAEGGARPVGVELAAAAPGGGPGRGEGDEDRCIRRLDMAVSERRERWTSTCPRASVLFLSFCFSFYSAFLFHIFSYIIGRQAPTSCFF